jgi:hypothetical protein
MASSAGFWSGAAFAVAAVVGGAAALPALLLQTAPQDEKTVAVKPAVSTTDTTGSWRPSERAPERKPVVAAPERPAKAPNPVASTVVGAPAAPEPAPSATTGASPEPAQAPRAVTTRTAPTPAAQPTEAPAAARPAPAATPSTPVQQAEAPVQPAPARQAAAEPKPDPEPAAEPSRAEKRKTAQRRAARRTRDRDREDLSHLPVVSADRLPPGARIVRPAPYPMREFYSRSQYSYSRSFY